jgi:predicted AAA+ superfamily ATPase
MNYVNRNLEKQLLEYLNLFPVVAITGPRQSGKSTLVQQLLNNEYRYVSLDDFRVIDQLENDPERFFSIYNTKVIFDEVQKYPPIFNHLKLLVDKSRSEYGQFVLTGSSQFTLQQNVSETLAGRIGLLKLLPFDFKEYTLELPSIILGSYPEQVLRNFQGHEAWYSSYLDTYIQRDVRSLANIGDLHDFSKLLKLLASNISNQFNASYYAKSLGISIPTVKRWISVLELSYIIFLLPSYHSNLGKRITKAPKVYFYDLGLASYLNGAINSKWQDGPLAGPSFENYIISECVKISAHLGKRLSFSYFREHNGDEIDLIIESGDSTKNIEIKQSMTFRSKMITTLKKYQDKTTSSALVYQGETLPSTSDLSVMNYKDFLLDL